MEGGKWKQVGLIIGVCLGMVFLVSTVAVAGAADEQSTDQKTGAIGANETVAPNAEAGLDQQVGQYETVYLDSGDSTARDGDIDSYEWEITHPDGKTSTPQCADCQQSQFVPEVPGTYNATVTVTDTNGVEASDTLYVEVNEREPPETEVDGVSSADPGSTEEFVVSGTPGTADLLSVEWAENGLTQTSAFFDDSTTKRYQTTLPLPGIYTIGATVVDTSGLSTQDEHQVEVGEEYSHYVVAIDETTAPVEVGEPMEVTVTVDNQGNLADTQPIALETPDRVVHAEKNVTLEPDEQQTVTLEWESCDTFNGEVTAVSQDDADSTLVEIRDGACDVDSPFEVERFDAPAQATEGETVETTATIRNAGDDPDTQVVTLADIYGRYTPAGTKTIDLEPDETRELSLQWESAVGEAGSGDLTVSTESDEIQSPFELHSMAEFDVSFADVESPADRSDDDLVATVDVENVGSASDTQTISLETDDLPIDETELSLSGLDSEAVTVRWENPVSESGTEEIAAASEDDRETKTVEIPEQESGDESGGGGGGGGSGPSYERHAQLNGMSTGSNPMEPGDSVSVSLDSIDNEIQAYEPRVGSVQYDGTWICDPSLNNCDSWDEDKWPTLDTYSESASSTNADTTWDGFDSAIMERDGGTEPEFTLDSDLDSTYEGDSGTIEITSQADYDSANEQNFNGDSVTSTIEWEVPEEDDDDDDGGFGSPGSGSGGDDDEEDDDSGGDDDEEDDSGDDGGDDDEEDPCDINPDNPDCNGDDGGDDGGDDDEEDDEEDDDDDGGGGSCNPMHDPACIQ